MLSCSRSSRLRILRALRCAHGCRTTAIRLWVCSGIRGKTHSGSAHGSTFGQPTRLTKRSALSQAARLFDPLGWLASVVVRAKILFQGT